MLKFTEYYKNLYITEAKSKGADTAFSGHANEHFTHQLLKDYVEHIGNSINSGVDEDTAHKRAIQHINNKKYNAKNYAHLEEIKNAAAHFGDEEMNNIHEDSKKTANAILNHLMNNYKSKIIGSMHVGKGGTKAVEKETGQKSEADILLRTVNDKGKQDQARAYLDHVGASLKYSKGISSTLKVHSPTINKMAQIIDDHYKKLHGKSSGIHEELSKLGAEGMSEQQKALAAHHEYLSNYFAKHGDKKLSYEPVLDKSGKVVGGNLSQDAVSHIRDGGVSGKDKKLRDAYDSMAEANLKMKSKIADVLHKHASSVLEHPSGDDVKESLIRSMGNFHKDKLPTFLVSTERSKPSASVYDIGEYVTEDLALNGVRRHKYTGKSTFDVGPMSFALDTRPTTSKNPITTYPINTTIKTSQVKALKNSEPPAPVISASTQPKQLSNEMFGRQVHADHEISQGHA